MSGIRSGPLRLTVTIGAEGAALESASRVATIDTPGMDANEALLRGAELHRTGRLAEAEALYRSVLAVSPDHPDALHLLGLIARAAGHPEQGIQLIRRALAVCPDLPMASYNLGLMLQAAKRYEEAEAALRQALARNPEHAEAHDNLGGVLRALGRLDEALISSGEALRLRADYPEAWSNRGTLLQDMGRPRAAVDAYRRALALRPEFAAAWHNLGEALQDLHQLDEAVASGERAVELEPENADARCGLAFSLLRRGDFQRGWQEYEWRWRRADLQPQRRELPGPAWEGAELAGRTILVYAEQGFGDTIQFSRYASILARQGAQVIVECQPALSRLLESLSGVREVIRRGEPLPHFDTHIALMSLPRICQTSLATVPDEVPYLRPPAELTRAWAARIRPRGTFRVGLVWAANPNNQQARSFRSLAPGELAPLQAAGEVQYFSLQMDAQAAKPFDMVDLTSHVEDFADTAAAILHLDLVVTVDTAVAHLAGALGRPVWVMLPFAADWRWLLDRDDSPWYPTMRLFRQPAWGDWASVVQAVRLALEELAGSRA